MNSIIIELEKALIDLSMPHVKLKSLIADDFVEYGKSGHVYHQKDVFEWLDNNPKRKIHAFDFQLKALSKNIALLTYVSEETENHQTFQVYRSSLWKKRQDQWQIIFHQGTLKNAT